MCENWLSAISFTCITLALILLEKIYWSMRKTRTPPGPYFLPFIGYAPLLQAPKYVSLSQLKKRFGDIISFCAYGRLIVVLNSYKAIRTAFITQKSSFSGRESLLTLDLLANNHGISNYDGKEIEKKRIAMIASLKRVNNIDETIYNNANEVLDVLELQTENPIDPKFIIGRGIFGIMWSVAFGAEYAMNAASVEPKNFEQCLNIFCTNNQNNAVLQPIQLLRCLRWSWIRNQKLMHYFFKITNTVLQYKKVLSYIQEKLSHFINADVENRASSYIDNYQRANASHSLAPADDPELMRQMFELFAAGTDTTIATVSWGLLFMAVHQNIQKRVHQELEERIGNEQSPCLQDRFELPYVTSVIHEIHRCASVVPLALPHRTTENTSIGIFSIPRDTIVLANIYASNMDAAIWDNPELFDPERFRGDNSHKSNMLLAFSVGSRACPGKSLAQKNIFIMFTSILHKFTIDLDPEINRENIDFTGSEGLVRNPPSVKLIFRKRLPHQENNV